MKEWHIGIWLPLGLGIYFEGCKLILAAFPHFTEAGVLGIGVMVLLGLIMPTLLWAYYTRFGKYHPKGKDSE